ncbi:MBL fold metallo-hydrolase [Mesobacillus maritimus]|uniref:MBL fold metallo-hydrolase n=1 Tax=Mesobacillus maritimus TaxID=1643336 RepID=UPI0038514556
MNKRNLLILFTIIFMSVISGCSQELVDRNTDSVKHEESSDLNNNNDPAKQNEDLRRDSTTNNEEKVTDNLPELKVHYIDVGQADSTLVQFSNDGEDFSILIDAGNWNRNDVVNYLTSQSISQIDIAIGTHPDADHIGQLDKILSSFAVEEVWLSGNTSNSQTFQRLISAIDTYDINYYEPRMGDEFEIGPLQIDVLYPRTISENDNDESISLKVTYGEVRFIFTGDASTSDELKMLQSGLDMDADILQLGHHGSSTSTHPTFLSEVSPSVAIYSAGVDNSYGHPHEEVVNRIKSSNINLYGTNVHGTIIVSTDGKDYKVLTKKDGTISPISNNKLDTTDGSSVAPESSKTPEISNNSCIDVNSASPEQLQEIIHIGPARAEELIKLRPFQTIDDLSRINGIGPARVQDIKNQKLACIGG